MMWNSENAWTLYTEAVEAMTTDSGQFWEDIFCHFVM